MKSQFLLLFFIFSFFSVQGQYYDKNYVKDLRFRLLLAYFQEYRGMGITLTPDKKYNVSDNENLKLANTYKLKSLPTLLLIEDGQVVYRLEGFHGREDLRMALKKVQVNWLPRSA